MSGTVPEIGGIRMQFLSSTTLFFGRGEGIRDDYHSILKMIKSRYVHRDRVANSV